MRSSSINRNAFQLSGLPTMILSWVCAAKHYVQLFEGFESQEDEEGRKEGFSGVWRAALQGRQSDDVLKLGGRPPPPPPTL